MYVYESIILLVREYDTVQICTQIMNSHVVKMMLFEVKKYIVISLKKNLLSPKPD
jgi:hypothetical protein